MINCSPNIRWLPVLAVCSFSQLTMALDIPGNPTTHVTRQVEKRAGQMVEHAMEQRLTEQVEAQSITVREPLEALPRALSISTTDGHPAFNDVALDNGFRAVERQWMVTVATSEITNLNHPGIQVLESRELSGLGMTVVLFAVSARLDSLEALQSALPELAGRLDRNHVFAPQSGATASGTAIPQWHSLCEDPVQIGMVDTAIAKEHPVFRGADIVQKHFVEVPDTRGKLSEPKAHGTAVASLIAGSREGRWLARLPAATVFNASVFYGRGDSLLSGATLNHLLQGLNWLAGQELSTINISLAGPDNRLLATAVSSLKRQGITLVAAVGNQGPSAPPLYPAAYPDVVGVTAVDASDKLYRWANRGKQVMFAALGVSVPVAHPDGGMVTDSGTSLAAPAVAAALACYRVAHSPDRAIELLRQEVRDLGEPGRDTRFGYGLLDP